MGRGASLQKAFHSLAMWRHHLLAAFCVLGPSSLEITHSLSESPKLVWTHLISSSFTQSYSDSPSLAWIQSDSRCLTRIHRASLALRLRSHSDSRTFPDSRADSLRLTQMFPRSFNLISVHTRFRSVQIFSDSLILVQIHSDAPRFTQIGSMSFRCLQTCSDLLRFTPDSDLLRFTHSLSDLRRPTQIYLDW